MVLVDYITRYPEAVQLRNTTTPTLAKGFIKIFTRIGLPREVLMDQGKNLMGRVMASMWEKLGVRHIHTSIYYPQCNGLVECFNQMLKRRLHKYVVDDPKGCPRMIDPLLFAVREVPQASTGYLHFEVWFGNNIPEEYWIWPENYGRTDLKIRRKGRRSTWVH